MTTLEKYTEALADEAFCEKLLGLESEEEYKAALAEKGVSDEDLRELRAIDYSELELDEDDLDNVSGGVSPSTAGGPSANEIERFMQVQRCNNVRAYPFSVNHCVCGYHRPKMTARGITWILR